VELKRSHLFNPRGPSALKEQPYRGNDDVGVFRKGLVRCILYRQETRIWQPQRPFTPSSTFAESEPIAGCSEWVFVMTSLVVANSERSQSQRKAKHRDDISHKIYPSD